MHCYDHCYCTDLRGVSGNEEVVQGLHVPGSLLHTLAGKADASGHVLRLTGSHALADVDGDRHDVLRRFLRHLLDVHATLSKQRGGESDQEGEGGGTPATATLSTVLTL